MKKLSKMMIGALMVAVMALSLVACGGDINGTYKFESLNGTVMGVELELDANSIKDNDMFSEMGNATIVISNGDTMSMTGMESDETYKFRLDGKNIIPVDDEGNDIPNDEYGGYSIVSEGGKIIMSMSMEGFGSITVTFKK